jgi:hypothetical protein
MVRPTRLAGVSKKRKRLSDGSGAPLFAFSDASQLQRKGVEGRRG